MKKKLLSGLIASSAMFGFAITAMAAEQVGAYANFETDLPGDSGAEEVSTLEKTNSNDYFTITLTDDDTYSYVYAWTESPAGNNYSSSDVAVYSDGVADKINYSNEPSDGSDVVLNLENVKSSGIHVSGNWTP